MVKDTTPLHGLPTELIMNIAESSRSVRSINALCRTNRYLYGTLNSYLYWYSAMRRRASKARHQALLWAAGRGQENTVKLALVPYTTAGGLRPKKPLLAAAQNGHTNIVKLLLAMPGVDIDFRNCTGDTALQLAVDNAHHEVVRLLVEAGADLSRGKRDPHIVKTMRGKHYERFDLNPRHRGIRPLPTAARYGYVEIIGLLLDADADVDLRGQWDETPLMVALNYERIEAAKRLVRGGADVTATHTHGRTPLMEAIRFGDITLVQAMLDVGDIDVNAVDYWGSSALTEAALRNSLDVTKLLLKVKNVDPAAGRPHETAMFHGHMKVFVLLRTAQARRKFKSLGLGRSH